MTKEWNFQVGFESRMEGMRFSRLEGLQVGMNMTCSRTWD